MKKATHFLMLAVGFLFSTVIMAQSTITGTILDAELNSPLPGANIVEKGTTNGTTSDFDGNFTLKTEASSGEIVITYVGYGSVTVSFNGNVNLENIKLTPDNSLEEIVIVGSGVIDLAEDRKTPIAVSTIKANQIQEKAGNSDLPELLKSTPSVHTTQRGGFGDGQLFLRGFDQTNTAFLLNGQPISKKDLDSLLKGKLDKAEVLCSDSHRSYGAFTKANNIIHKKFNASKGQRTLDKIYHVQNVNNMDMRLRKFMDSFNGVATKYLQNYLNWFLVLEKIKNSTSKMTMVTAIAFASNNVWFEYKQQLFNMLIRT